ncbi:62f6d8e3-0231-49d6-aed1-f976079fa266 [Thermothielavioides terrestris]|uniref:62f6d8e3-0231-49d6-aed1-f976079fa266 n=1 Tax=Thermothielavioides terrestris TaxID=2587410 RepID=A0A446B7B1_9PEZI|nr:62f6d8e3-0231-49d6-aed1-f976079fa266 [Thermothielavioides terrestris]
MAKLIVPQLLSALCFLTAFILMIVAVIAGVKPGFLEDYELLLINTSALGKNISIDAVPNTLLPTRTTAIDCSNAGGFLGQACDSAASAVASASSAVDDAAGDAADKASGIANSVANSLADKLHIPDFYAFYALKLCEGDFTPSGGCNFTTCHSYRPNHANTISALLDATLSLDLGPLGRNISLSDIGITQSLKSALEYSNAVLQGAAGLIFLSIAGTILAFVVSVLCLLAYPDNQPRAVARVSFWILTFAASAAFLLVLGWLVGVITSLVAERRVNDAGAVVGVSAAVGTNEVSVALYDLRLS